MILELALCAAILVILAFAYPKADSLCSWVMGAALAYAAGTRTGGFDYENYVLSIDWLRLAGSEDFLERLEMAKDPLFLMFVNLAEFISEDPQVVFALIAIASVATKVFATRMVPGRRTLFISFYAVFLAPALEFAAIRAGLAIGFVLLALAVTGPWRIVSFALGVASHVAVIAAALGLLFKKGAYKQAIFAVAVVVVVLPWFMALIGETERFGSYYREFGTLNAFALPLASLATLICVGRVIKPGPTNVSASLQLAYAAALACVSLALLLVLQSVTFGGRVLEIGWVLMLAPLVAMSPKESGRTEAAAAWILMIMTLTGANILRNTWAIMFTGMV